MQSGPDESGTGAEICVAANHGVCKADAVGSSAGDFGGTGFMPVSPERVAVDAGGDVYVTDLANLRVQKFDSEGHFIWAVSGDVNKAKAKEGASEAEQEPLPRRPYSLTLLLPASSRVRQGAPPCAQALKHDSAQSAACADPLTRHPLTRHVQGKGDRLTPPPPLETAPFDLHRSKR